MASLSEFRIDIAPDVQQCPSPFIDRQLIHVAIEFCRDTKIAEPPALNTTELPDALIEYIEGIAHGVKSRLFAMPDKPWTELSMVDYHKLRFDEAKADAKAAYIIGEQSNPLTIESKPFGF
ncbi:hypothetical protein EBI00_02505 [Marinomonas hwangdonensis]|uniref:Uncharacterized protein n=1 Tax=Marinomonas hwangdonensis TaxID=1053647 RepID=A0A3M8QBG7_9GAMM|nr:hypothetical protein [Marinomonas hwangdonensis]RNF52991.1 hypothetical protein EBI00_02505 [Marinomonas hwangdonensis]